MVVLDCGQGRGRGGGKAIPTVATKRLNDSKVAPKTHNGPSVLLQASWRGVRVAPQERTNIC